MNNKIFFFQSIFDIYKIIIILNVLKKIIKISFPDYEMKTMGGNHQNKTKNYHDGNIEMFKTI